MIATLKSASKPVSPSAWKAQVLKLGDEKSEVAEVGRKAMKAYRVDAAKANEIDYSTEQYYGDEWVGVAYSQSLWELIRNNTFVLSKLPQLQFPDGVESMTLPLESTDPTWYTVAEATSSATAYAGPTPTVTASVYGTGNVSMTLGKLGARVVWTGELNESSLIPFAAQLRNQMGVSGGEYLEAAIIDGDTSTTSSENINNAGGAITTAAYYLFTNGFRKSPLVTTTANSRSAAGSLKISDYLDTVKLMGVAGKNALDKRQIGFIVDVNTYWKTLTLAEVLTKDVYSSPVLEGSDLTQLWGYGLNASAQMHKSATASLKANSSGYVNTTDATANLYGAILAVRYDQWKLGWMRRMTMESTRWAASDTTEIVAMLRAGLIQRDTEASSISYYVGV
jgi:hypothetical protein